MEAIKEVKILHYVIIIILGLQLSFTFKKLNSIEDKIEAIAMESDSTLTTGRYALTKTAQEEFRMLDTVTGAIWYMGRVEDERRWLREFPEVGEKGFSYKLRK